jgi:hypothetical protein
MRNRIHTVGANTIRATATYTRPNDTTAYAAGDALSDNTTAGSATNLTFSSVARSNGESGLIVDAWVIDSVAAGTKPSLELWLYDTAPAAAGDNAAFAPSDAEALNVVAVIPFTTFYAGSNNCVSRGDFTAVPFVCASGATALYGQVVVRNAYTPSANEVFTFKLKIMQD